MATRQECEATCHVVLNTHSEQQEATFGPESDHIMLENLVTLEVELPRMDQPLRGFTVWQPPNPCLCLSLDGGGLSLEGSPFIERLTTRIRF